MAEKPIKLLFVDDEASIRMTLPPVLEKSGFEVRAAESVSDALFEINSRPFDVLISDLNIAEEGDGFLVTSAMRHVQPECVTFILTGYPAFETALQAIHNHVDDYLVKPVEIQALIRTLQEKMQNRTRPWAGKQRLAELLRRNAQQILSRVSMANGGTSKQKSTRMAEAKRPEPGLAMTNFLNGLIRQLESNSDTLNGSLLRAAPEQSKKWMKANLSPADLARGFWELEREVYRIVQENMGSLEIGALISDLRRFTGGLHTLMEKSLEPYSLRPPAPGRRKPSAKGIPRKRRL